MSNLAIGLIALAILDAFWGLAAIAAASNNMLTVSQMLASGIKKGIPYFRHYGMWNDFVFVHPLAALLVALLVRQWLGQWWGIPIALIALYIAWHMNRDWVLDTNVIQSHAGVAADKIHSTGKMSLVGWIHVPHMAVLLTIVGMALVSTVLGDLPWRLAAGAACILLGHVLMGQHPVLRVLNPSWNPLPSIDYQNTMLGGYVVLTAAGLILIYNHFFG